jgi:Copper type II ascorbate-dependent monooxygenase, C-terminal domain/Copper type II ascorbate-dependent monooxygenase, N-terminal domain
MIDRRRPRCQPSALWALLPLWLLAAACAAQRDPAVGGGADGAAGAAGGAASRLPCDVGAVLAAKCQTCHGAKPIYGAPMSLMSYGDTQAPLVSNPTLPVWQMMRTRIHSATAPMPPSGQPPLASAELAALDGWLGAGAPAAITTAVACGGPGGADAGAGGNLDGGGLAADAGAGIGPGYLPCTPNHAFTAHATGSSTARYPVPVPTSDSYVCFNFRSPFVAGEQAIAFAPVIDDTRVVHHFILYGTNANLTDGSITTNCAGATGNDTHVIGWAPGGQNIVLDPDVGLVLDYTSFQLQIHYNNALYPDGADASGVAICTTTTPRTHAAGIVTLGKSLFTIPANANDYPVTGNCTNLASDGQTAMTVIETSPHMHLLGTGFRTQHLRGGVDLGDLSNVPIGTWSFDNQRHYPVSPRRQVLPGDRLQTTCYYDNPTSSPVSFGTRTRDEMCYDFITVYPYAGATRRCTGL